MVFPIALRICAILSRIAQQRGAGDGIAPRACIARVCFVHAATEYVGSVAQERVAGAIASHTNGVKQSIITDDHLHGLIWRQAVGKTSLANFVWIIRPLIPVSDKVGLRHPFNDESIRGSGLASRDIDGYV